MPDLHILDLSGDALDALLHTLAADRARAAPLLARLDAAPIAALSLGLGSAPDEARDRTVAAAFLLARTRRLAVLATLDPARQHPLHVARTVATLQALHPGRIGLIAHARPLPQPTYRHGGGVTGNAAGYLQLLSALWDGWPLDTVAHDSTQAAFVDAQRLRRVADPRFPSIGGPITLPVDGAAKPPLLLAHAHAEEDERQVGGSEDSRGVDLHLRATRGGLSLTARSASARVHLRLGGTLNDAWLSLDGRGAEALAAPALRERLGLGASGPAGLPAEPVFQSGPNALRV